MENTTLGEASLGTGNLAMNGQESVSALEGSTPISTPLRLPGVRDSKGRVYATGKRKTAVARVWLKPGKGNIVINGKIEADYFKREACRMTLTFPLRQVERMDTYDIWCTVKGGGMSGQAGAIRHGIGLALQNYDPATRPSLKAAGVITRDARKVERKKPGRKKARKSFQFSKR